MNGMGASWLEPLVLWDQPILRPQIENCVASWQKLDLCAQVGTAQVRRDQWRAFAHSGMTGYLLPGARVDETGGVGNLVSALGVCFEAGYCLSPWPVMEMMLSARLLALLGHSAKEPSLARVLAGDVMLVSAFEERGEAWEPEQLSSRVMDEADGYVLRGEKYAIWHGCEPDALLFTALLDNAHALFWLERSQWLDSGCWQIGRSRELRWPMANFRADGLYLPQSSRLAGVEVLPLLRENALMQAFLTAAQALGGARRVWHECCHNPELQICATDSSAMEAWAPLLDNMRRMESLLEYAVLLGVQVGGEAEIFVRMLKISACRLFLEMVEMSHDYFMAASEWELWRQFRQRAQRLEAMAGDGVHHRRHLEGMML